MNTKTGLKELLTTPVCGLLARILTLGILGMPASAQTTFVNQDFKLTASDGAALDQFGHAVAISGDVAVIGAFDDDNVGLSSGSAYIFRFDGMMWNQEATLTASDAAAGDRFGFSVSISGDVAVIGARSDDDAGAGLLDSGSVYIFRFNDISWIQEAKLTASDDAAAADEFGFSVSISGNVAVVGAPFDNAVGSGSGAAPGSAYIFRFDGMTWNQETKLTAAAAGDQFGLSVSIGGDLAVIGARLDDDAGSASGSAYIFRFDDTTTMWNQEAKLTALDAAAGDQFGHPVAISGDVAVIGAIGNDDAGSLSGSAYIFRFDDTTTMWNQEAKLTASDPSAGDQFGLSVSISGDVAVVGAPFDDDAGSAYVFRFDGVVEWVEDLKLTALDAAPGDSFGSSVAVSSAAVIGAFGDDDNGSFSGSAYIFGLDTDSDGDGVPDSVDNCPAIANSGQEDFDGDGVGDVCDADDDNDGLLDATEVDSAMGGDCPDPLDADSDGDTISDGDEVAAGTNPCNADTDGDGVPDNIDPDPKMPNEFTEVMEEATRILSEDILDINLNLGLFNGPNTNANTGRRNALANRATDAANAIAIGDIEGAIDSLISLLAKIDGQSPPPDWMDDSPEKTALAVDVVLLIALLLLE